jgi:hypothetical protein
MLCCGFCCSVNLCRSRCACSCACSVLVQKNNQVLPVLENVGSEPLHVEDLADSGAPLVVASILATLEATAETATLCCSVLAVCTLLYHPFVPPFCTTFLHRVSHSGFRSWLERVLLLPVSLCSSVTVHIFQLALHFSPFEFARGRSERERRAILIRKGNF